MRRFILVLLLASGLATVGPLPASADHVPPHQHFLVTPDGTLIAVGPDAFLFGTQSGVRPVPLQHSLGNAEP
jgi:hypothetical protein